MSERTIQSGTKMFFGAPANPMPSERRNAIISAVTGIAGLSEAHLPQCFIEGDSEARQILAIGVDRRDDIPHVAEAIMANLKSVLPPDDFIDILPYPQSSFPSSIREAKCQIIGSAPKSWWKFW